MGTREYIEFVRKNEINTSTPVQNIMARGQQKIQSQQKNAERQAKMKKAKGSDQKKAAQAALKIICGVCRSQIGDPKTYRQHFEAKHPKLPTPADLKELIAEGKC